MTDGDAAMRTDLVTRLEDLEYHRSVDVEARLAGAQGVEAEADIAGSVDLKMRARLVQADMRMRSGQVTEAAKLATEVNRWAQEHAVPALLARSHLILSSIFESVGDSASGLDHALQALGLLGDEVPDRTRGNFLLRLADALSVAGSFDEARRRYRDAERLFSAIGDLERQISALNNLAYAEFEAGNAQRSWDVAEEMRTLAASSGFVLSTPLLDTLARTYIGMGQYQEAAATLEQALETFRREGDVEADTQAGILLTLAEVRMRQGELVTAQEVLDASRAICVERNLRTIHVDVLRVQAELHAAASRFEQAYGEYRLFHSQYLQLSSMRREASARTRQAIFETAEARHDADRFWRQARTDALTGLPNRRFVDEEIPRRLEDVRAGIPLVVAIVDADHFKRVNDQLSHQVGDRVIAEIGRILEATLSADPEPGVAASPFVARLGGEEFLVVLPGREMDDAGPVLSAMCAAVAGHAWTPLIGGMSLTVSVGADRAQPTDTQSTLLARVDRNLYAAKSSGRNRVIVEGSWPRPGQEAVDLPPRMGEVSAEGAS